MDYGKALPDEKIIEQLINGEYRYQYYLQNIKFNKLIRSCKSRGKIRVESSKFKASSNIAHYGIKGLWIHKRLLHSYKAL